MERKIRIALAGNPNCGKTTLFNALTCSNQYVGNWPGVTVEKKEGVLKNSGIIVTDLPGIYSLSPYTPEEIAARDYLLEENPDAVLNVVDGTNLERSLFLTTQLKELEIPLVVAVNMMDLVRKNGDEISIKRLSEKLGCAVVEMSALKEKGIFEAAEAAVSAAKSKKLSPPPVFSLPVEHALSEIEKAVLKNPLLKHRRWYAVKIFEHDEKAAEKFGIGGSALLHIEKEIRAAEREFDDDGESIITNERYRHIAALLKNCYNKKNEGALSASDKIDRIVASRRFALPVFAAVMFLVYFFSVSTLGTAATDWTNNVLFGEWIKPFAKNFLESCGAAEWVVSLAVEGILGGLAAPLSFAPQMAVVFFFLSVLEDCGYMARAAFIMDGIFRRFGLSGKSFISFLVGSGCAVPGIMACRTIENEKDRRMTMMTTSFIPCGAKLPVIALVAGFLAGGAWWVAPLMYFLGIAAIMLSCVILKKTRSFSGEAAPFVIELPQYRFPSLKGVLFRVWERIREFLKKAGTVLFLCCGAMWFLASFGFENGIFGLAETKNSLLAVIGGAVAPFFAPLGFGTWQAVAASLAGFAAKEGIVTTVGVLLGLGEIEGFAPTMKEQLGTLFPSGISAVSFLLFNLFSSPCAAAISVLAKEIGSEKYFIETLVFQNVFAYCLSLVVYQLGGLIAGELRFCAGTFAALLILAAAAYFALRPERNNKKGDV